MNLVAIMLMTLFGSSNLVGCENLNCEFMVNYYSVVGTLYSCYVSSLVNSNDNINMDGYSGVHKINKNVNNVKGVFIYNTNTKYIPTNLGSIFKLTAFAVEYTELVEIRSKDFHNMQNLEYLFLANNRFSFIPRDAFTKITKLKVISLEHNQIKYVRSGLFDKLTNLNEIYFTDNICLNKRYGCMDHRPS